MKQTEFVIYLEDSDEDRYRHQHTSVEGAIIGFRIQYEAFIAGEWHCVVRYDSAHDVPHRDILHPDGTQTKEWYTLSTNADILTLGQRDIRENWASYRARYEKEMAR